MGRRACTFAVLGVLVFGAAAWAIGVGDPAPPLTIAKWVKGEPVDPSQADGKTTYVVEFWATWCPPCKVSIPHLGELQAKYKDKGLVIVGVSTEDAATVEAFVAEHKEMQYHVAVDKDEATDNAWMKDVEGIPHAFIVDKKGVVVWAGHPMGELDDVLEKVLTGSYDFEQAKKIGAKIKELKTAVENGENEKAEKLLDELIALEPTKYEYYEMKATLLDQRGESAEILEIRRRAAKAFLEAKDANSLNMLAWTLVTDEDLSVNEPALALQCAEEAVKLTERKSAQVLDTLARAYYAIGMLEKAIAIEQEAIAGAADEEEKKQFEGAAKFYETAKSLRDKLTDAAK